MFTEEKNTEQVLLTRLEFLPPFLTDLKTKWQSYRTYYQRFRKGKEAIWKLPRSPALLPFVRGEKPKKSLIFFETVKNSFYNTTNKEHPFH